jgi:two-component system, sensor histidine kinase and response regulator
MMRDENRPADEAIDWAVLNGLREFQAEGEPDLIQELVALFKSETPSQIEAIRAAIATGDAERLRKAAHSLKGSSANLGVRLVSALGAELERTGRSGTVEGADAMLVQLEHEYERACRALDAGQRGRA